MSLQGSSAEVNLQVRFADDSDQSDWDEYVLSNASGTAYQLFGWGRAVERAYGYKRSYFLAEAKGKICGVMPCIDHRVPLIGDKVVSLPYCDCGGMLTDNEKVAMVLWQRALRYASERNCGWCMRSSFSLAWAGENLTDKVRMVLDLPGNSEQLLGNLRSKLRSQVRKPSRDGLKSVIGAGELASEFYDVLAENMRDLGSPVHSRKWVKAIIEEYGERVRVAVVYMPDGAPAAAGIILLHSETVTMPWASSLRRYNSMNPNMLLYWTVLAFAADSGYKRFDFGRSSHNEGTWRFKEQWGAVPHTLFWYEFNEKGKPRSRRMSRGGFSGGRAFAETLWRQLPMRAANFMGPRIRKYISL